MTTRLHRTVAALILAIITASFLMFPVSRLEAPGAISSKGVVAPTGSADLSQRQPLIFEANRGQAAADVRFVGRANNLGLLLKTDEAVFALRKTQEMRPRDASAVAGDLSHQLLSMKFEGANPMALISGQERQEVRANYFIGNDPDRWVRGIDTYSRVQYSDVYHGIDLVFYANERRIEYDFGVAPGADPRDIRLRFEGAENLELSSDGALILHTAGGEFKHERPVAYQERNGSRREVAVAFRQLDAGAIGFEVGSYDPSQTLIIDPILVYSTYLGGSNDDFARGIVVDAAGNLYVTGDSFSPEFLRDASATNSDVFVGKLSTNGLLLTYTFFGGAKNDFATGLAVDASGNIYLGGDTQSPDFPIFNSVGSALSGDRDAFAVKLPPAADQFVYSSLVGGSGLEGGVSITVDADGNAYLTGKTSSTDYPTVGPVQPAYGGGDSDAFISKLAADGKSLVYSTFLGGGATENANAQSGIAVDASGNAYVVGETQSTDFPTVNALRTTKNGPASSSDGFVAKLDAAGANFVYATYLGGSGDDSAFGVQADQAGNAYVTGQTRSASFTGSGVTRPTTLTADAFVAKLNATGSAISYLTFVGGITGDESGNAIVVDSSGNAVIAGSAGEGVPTVNSVQSFSRGLGDAFVAKLSQTGAITLLSYLGGSEDDRAFGVGLDGSGAIYFAGFTHSDDFLTASPLVKTNAGARDIFIAKIDPNSNPDGPVLLQAVISGKNLILYGQGFDPGAKLRINDVQVKTRNEDPAPTQILFAKKGAKRIQAGSTVQLQVENPDGQRSNFIFFTKPE